MGPLDFRSHHLLPLELGGVFQRLHLDLTYLRIGHVDPEFSQGSNNLLGAGLHSEAGQGIVDRSRLAGALSSLFSHRNTGQLPRR